MTILLCARLKFEIVIFNPGKVTKDLLESTDWKRKGERTTTRKMKKKKKKRISKFWLSAVNQGHNIVCGRLKKSALKLRERKKMKDRGSLTSSMIVEEDLIKMRSSRPNIQYYKKSYVQLANLVFEYYLAVGSHLPTKRCSNVLKAAVP